MARFGVNENVFDAYVRAAAERHKPDGWGVPEFGAWIKSHMAAETAPPFNWRSFRQEPSGNASIGLMQVLRSNARDLTDEQLFDPATNIERGTQIIAKNWAVSKGDMDAAISAYNGGWSTARAMGHRATVPIVVCLARDPTGKCVVTRNVAVGEFGNQPYVDKVKSYFVYFLRNPIPPDTMPPATLPGGGGPSLKGGPATPATSTPSAGGSGRNTVLGVVALALLLGLAARRFA